MRRTSNVNASKSKLRQQAEAILRKAPHEMAPASEADMGRLLYELQVHQVELTLQNAELRRSQEELQRTRDKYVALYDFAPVGYLTLDGRGTILEANLTAATMLGMKRGALLGTLLSRFICRDVQDTFYLHCRRVMDEGATHTCDLQMQRPDGTSFVARLESHAVDATAQSTGRCHTILSDVTALKQEEAARQQNEHLAILGRMAATFSHEVRNPLQALRLYAEILEEEVAKSLPDSQSESREHIDYALTVILEQAARMSHIVQDYLSLARLGTISREPTDLGRFITEIAHDQCETLTRHGVTLRLEGVDDLGWALIHTNTLRRAILNLIQNAMEAMGDGGCLTLRGRHANGQLHLDIMDTGSGIAPEMLAKIFTPFHTTKAEGTGLGLYVVQEIIAAHDGGIGVESEPGQGTTFTLTLPRFMP